MGAGSWSKKDFMSYSCSIGRSVFEDGVVDLKTTSVYQNFTQKELSEKLNPYKVIRECRDSEEHPETIPVILALDVTGSMGHEANEVAAELNTIMTALYEQIKDVEFMIMAIGDFTYDRSPLQVSQFESDVRIAEQLDQVYFEGGGGPNSWESYTSAWLFGATQTDLDCWKRGKRGIIITMGDEELNPWIDVEKYIKVTGYTPQTKKDLNTDEVWKMVVNKYQLFHINIEHDFRSPNLNSWRSRLGLSNVFSCKTKNLAQIIPKIIVSAAGDNDEVEVESAVEENPNEISW